MKKPETANCKTYQELVYLARQKGRSEAWAWYVWNARQNKQFKK